MNFNTSTLTHNIAILFILILGAGIYLPGLSGNFVLDDFPNILENNLVWEFQSLDYENIIATALSSNAGPLQRPISTLSFAFNVYFFGHDPLPFKVVNLILHLINGILILFFARLISIVYVRLYTPDHSDQIIKWLPLTVCAAWLLSPLHLTTVLYVVQRMTSLSTLFVLLGLVFYLWGRLRQLDNRAGYPLILLGPIIFGLLGLLSKESAVLLPLYTLILEITLLRFRNADDRINFSLVSLYTALVVLPFIISIIWLFWSGRYTNYSMREFNINERLLTESRVLLHYIKWLILPNLNDLSLYHDNFLISKSLFNPISTLFSILSIVFLLILATIKSKKWPLFSLGIFWFFIGHSLESTVLPLELVFEHRNYLPSFGIFLSLFSILLLFKSRRRLKIIKYLFIISLITTYGAISWVRSIEWQNTYTLAKFEAERHPDSKRAMLELGRIYAEIATLDPKPDLIQLAYEHLEKTRKLDNDTIVPEIDLIILSHSINRPSNSEWFASIESKLSQNRILTNADILSLKKLISCIISMNCKIEKQNIDRIFSAALNNRSFDNQQKMQAYIITVYADYLINVAKNYDLAYRFLIECTELSPKESQFWINLLEFEIRTENYIGAEKTLRNLHELNKFGRLNTQIKKFENQIIRKRNM